MCPSTRTTVLTPRFVPSSSDLSLHNFRFDRPLSRSCIYFWFYPTVSEIPVGRDTLTLPFTPLQIFVSSPQETSNPQPGSKSYLRYRSSSSVVYQTSDWDWTSTKTNQLVSTIIKNFITNGLYESTREVKWYQGGQRSVGKSVQALLGSERQRSLKTHNVLTRPSLVSRNSVRPLGVSECLYLHLSKVELQENVIRFSCLRVITDVN